MSVVVGHMNVFSKSEIHMDSLNKRTCKFVQKIRMHTYIHTHIDIYYAQCISKQKVQKESELFYFSKKEKKTAVMCIYIFTLEQIFLMLYCLTNILV